MAGGAARAAPLLPRTCDFCCVSTTIHWGHMSSFDEWSRIPSLVPPFPINTHCFQNFQRGEFLGIVSLICVVFFFLLFFIFFVDHVIGKREMHRMKVRVLVMEGDIL